MNARFSAVLLSACVGLTACSSESQVNPVPTPVGDAAIDSEASAPETGLPEASTEAETGPDRYAALIKAVEAERTELGAPGVAIAVIEGGKVTFSRGFGSKHPQNGGQVEPTTLFRIGSVTKMMTATAVLQQVQSGDVKLDAPITQYIPEFKLLKDPTWAPSMQVQHLLTHETSILDWLKIDSSDKDDSALFSYLTGFEFSQVYLMAESGRFWNYSNPNFMLAGLLAERVSGTYYRELMKTKVFDPLGMSRTFFLGQEVLADGDYASGKTMDWTTGTTPAVAEPDSYDNPWGRPAGYAWSSVLDLAHFADFLMHGKDSVLSPALVQEMQGERVNTESYLDLVHYGYGLFRQRAVVAGTSYYVIDEVSHGGDINGFAADVFMIPSKDFAFIALSNADGAHFGKSYATALQTLVDLPAPSALPDPEVDPSKFGIYAGQYLDPYNVGPITITTDGKDLFVEAPELTKANLAYDKKLQCYVRNNCLFTVKESTGDLQLQVTFILDGGGKVEYLRNRIFVAKKLPDSDAGVPEGGVPEGGTPFHIPPAFDAHAFVQSARRDSWSRRPWPVPGLAR